MITKLFPAPQKKNQLKLMWLMLHQEGWKLLFDMMNIIWGIEENFLDVGILKMICKDARLAKFIEECDESTLNSALPHVTAYLIFNFLIFRKWRHYHLCFRHIIILSNTFSFSYYISCSFYRFYRDIYLRDNFDNVHTNKG